MKNLSNMSQLQSNPKRDPFLKLSNQNTAKRPSLQRILKRKKTTVSQQKWLAPRPINT